MRILRYVPAGVLAVACGVAVPTAVQAATVTFCTPTTPQFCDTPPTFPPRPAKDGKDGKDGADGKDGKDGKAGKPGKAGPRGPAAIAPPPALPHTGGQETAGLALVALGLLVAGTSTVVLRRRHGR